MAYFVIKSQNYISIAELKNLLGVKYCTCAVHWILVEFLCLHLFVFRAILAYAAHFLEAVYVVYVCRYRNFNYLIFLYNIISAVSGSLENTRLHLLQLCYGFFKRGFWAFRQRFFVYKWPVEL